jgi:hypothetical protein
VCPTDPQPTTSRECIPFLPGPSLISPTDRS